MKNSRKIIALASLMFLNQIATAQWNKKNIAIGMGTLTAAIGARWAWNYLKKPEVACNAAAQGNTWKLRACIIAGAPLNNTYRSKTYPQFTSCPVERAAVCNQPKTLKMLLESGACPNVNTGNIRLDTTVLAWLVEYNMDGKFDNCIELLLKHGANPNLGRYPSIERACGKEPLFRKLVLHGARITESCINISIEGFDHYLNLPAKLSLFGYILDQIKDDEQMQKKVVRKIFITHDDLQNRSEFFSLALERIKNKKELLDYSICAFSQKQSLPIEWAIELINRGANVNAKDDEGNTPLDLAVKSGNLPLVQLLIGHGAHTNAPMLLEACRQYDIEMVKVLLESGIGLDHQNDDGQTALIFLARFKGSEYKPFKLIRLLLFMGADHRLNESILGSHAIQQNALLALERWSDPMEYDRRSDDDPTKKEWLLCLQCLNDPTNISRYLTEEEKKEFSEILKKRIAYLKSYEHNSTVVKRALTWPGYTDIKSKGPLDITAEYLGAELIQ